MSSDEAWLRERAYAGDPIAAYELGKLLDSRGDTKAAIALWIEAAVSGHHAPSATNVGVRFARMNEHDAAEKWFKLGATLGDPTGNFNLGLLWSRRGRPAEAERFWRLAAASGDATSASNIGELLAERGESEEAEEWWRRGAEGGDISGAWQLAYHLIDTGRADEAERWLERCAESGNAEAASNLGVLLAKRRNFEGAEHWWRIAIAAGDATAAVNLMMSKLRNGKSPEEVVELVVPLAEGNPKLVYDWGRVMEREGQHELAELWMQIAARMDLPESS